MTQILWRNSKNWQWSKVNIMFWQQRSHLCDTRICQSWKRKVNGFKYFSLFIIGKCLTSWSLTNGQMKSRSRPKYPYFPVQGFSDHVLDLEAFHVVKLMAKDITVILCNHVYFHLHCTDYIVYWLTYLNPVTAKQLPTQINCEIHYPWTQSVQYRSAPHGETDKNANPCGLLSLICC